MSQALTHITAPTLKISAALGKALEARKFARFGDMVIHGKRTPKTQALHDEAEQRLAALEAGSFALPSPEARRAMIASFDRELGALVANPRSPEQRTAWRLAVETITEDVPAGAWTAEFRRDALRSFKFMPSPAEFYELLEKHVQLLREKRATLRLFVGESVHVPEEPRTPPTEEQIRQVDEIVANLFPTQREKHRA